MSLSSVQFSSRWYLCARKSPYALHPVSQKFPQRCLWNGSSVRLTDDGPLSSFQGRSSSTSFFPRLSPPGDRWCDVLGFVPEGSVSSSSTFQVFRDKSHLCWLLFRPVYLLGHFHSHQHVRGSTTTAVFQHGCQTLAYASLGFLLHCSLFVASSLSLWGWRHVRPDCHLWIHHAVGWQGLRN